MQRTFRLEKFAPMSATNTGEGDFAFQRQFSVNENSMFTDIHRVDAIIATSKIKIILPGHYQLFNFSARPSTSICVISQLIYFCAATKRPNERYTMNRAWVTQIRTLTRDSNAVSRKAVVRHAFK